MPLSSPTYDVALSFAGEDRSCAEAVAEALKALEITVFYDKYEKATLWGKDLYSYLSDLYQHQAKFCVMFISKHYSEKMWTNLERKAAQARAFLENTDYLLPIRLDQTDVPGLLPTVSYLNWHEETVSSITDAILNKLGKYSKHKKFTFDYPFDPEPGVRSWYQIDEVKWIEQYPSGHTSTFVMVDKITKDGDSGIVVRKVLGDAERTQVPDYSMEVFIPDPDSELMWLSMRHHLQEGWTQWEYFAEIWYTD
jgi:hypothetical protein